MIKIDPSYREALLTARKMPDDARKELRASVFRSIHRAYAIPKGTKLSVEIDDTEHPHFLVLMEKDTGLPYGVPAPEGQVSNDSTNVQTDDHKLLKLLQDSSYVQHLTHSNAVTIGFGTKLGATETVRLVQALRERKD